MTAVNPGPALKTSPNSQAVMGSLGIVVATLGSGPYDLDLTNLPGFVAGGTGILKIKAASGGTTINSLAPYDAPIGFEILIINTSTTDNLIFNNLAGIGANAASSFSNMNGGQVAVLPGGAAICKRIIATGSTQGYWQFQ
jgi:hypothetical protein